MESYMSRVEAAAALPASFFTRETERELLAVYDQYGHTAGQVVLSGAAHRLGLIHTTADILIITPASEIMLAQRDQNDPMFPSYFALSAGGHSLADETPRETARRELAEELNIEIPDLCRIVPLHDESRGLPNFYREWCSHDGRVKMWQFAPDASIHRLLNPLPSADSPQIEWPEDWASWRSLLSGYEHGSDPLVFLNQEFTFYYVVRLSTDEYARFTTSSYPAQMKTVSFPQLLSIVGDPMQSTDGIRCLAQGGCMPNLQSILAGRL